MRSVVFTLSIVVVIRLIMDPDSVRARQSDSMLKLASQTLTCMNDGMDYKAAQKICGLLLPSTALSPWLSPTKADLGYAGFEEAQNLPGSIIRTHATHATLADGKLRILFTPEDIGFPSESSNIKAAIIVPLAVGATSRARSSSTIAERSTSARRRSPSPKGSANCCPRRWRHRRWKSRRSWPRAWS